MLDVLNGRAVVQVPHIDAHAAVAAAPPAGRHRSWLFLNTLLPFRLGNPSRRVCNLAVFSFSRRRRSPRRSRTHTLSFGQDKVTEEDTNSLWGEGPAAISHFSLSSEGRLQTTGKGEKKKRLLCRFGGGGTRFSLAIFKRYVIE